MRKRDPRFPRQRGTLPPGASPPAPTTGQRPPVAGRALAGGFGPPAGPDASVAPWQGRWPLPGQAARAQAQGFPALRSASPCARHFFSTLLNPMGRSRRTGLRGAARPCDLSHSHACRICLQSFGQFPCCKGCRARRTAHHALQPVAGSCPGPGWTSAGPSSMTALATRISGLNLSPKSSIAQPTPAAVTT